jgi:hypothetical protein
MFNNVMDVERNIKSCENLLRTHTYPSKNKSKGLVQRDNIYLYLERGIFINTHFSDL